MSRPLKTSPAPRASAQRPGLFYEGRASIPVVRALRHNLLPRTYSGSNTGLKHKKTWRTTTRKARESPARLSPSTFSVPYARGVRSGSATSMPRPRTQTALSLGLARSRAHGVASLSTGLLQASPPSPAPPQPPSHPPQHPPPSLLSLVAVSPSAAVWSIPHHELHGRLPVRELARLFLE